MCHKNGNDRVISREPGSNYVSPSLADTDVIADHVPKNFNDYEGFFP